MIQKRVFVSGRVQGVGFRRQMALFASSRFRGLCGWVRNLPDGRVEAVFRGTLNEVEEMVQWCRRGPPAASVTQVDVIDEAVDSSLGSFDVAE
jgi:acylphosphatase